MAQIGNWAVSSADIGGIRGTPQADIVGMATFGVVTGTEKRDVSEILDLLALSETPFLNAVGWGPESGGTSIEWISEDIGPGYIQGLSAVASNATSIVVNSLDGVQGSQLAKQLHAGTILYAWCSAKVTHAIGVVMSELVGVSIDVSWLDLGVGVSTYTSSLAQANFYVLGNVVNEGSRPGRPKPRARVVCSNGFTILRRDVAITGSMANTEMYAIGSEDQHQIMLRMKEIQRERERMALYSMYYAQTSIAAGLINGVFGFLRGIGATAALDWTTKTLTETAVNTVVSKVWSNGGRNLSCFGDISQTAKFTRWDKNRIRMRVNEGLGGGRITSYLTEAGIEIDLIPMGNVPDNLFFVLDTAKIKMRAKTGRKALLEKLGKMGDSDDWQILSEFTMEMKGYNTGQHGAFFSLV
jgi:hypothetical protein